QNAAIAFNWYKKYFGFSAIVFEDKACAALMTRYTGGDVQQRYAVLAMNMQGGGGFEIWQYTSRTPSAPKKAFQLGDTGVNTVKLRSKDILAAYQLLKGDGSAMVTPISDGPCGIKHFYVKDPFENHFEITEDTYWFAKNGHPVGGVCGVVIGVSNIEKAVQFYQNILGYNMVLFDKEDVFDEWEQLAGGKKRVRRVVLQHREKYSGPFSRLLGPTTIELVEAKEGFTNKIFEDRYWGDLGFIHVCYDVNRMKELGKVCEKAGYGFTVNSESSFDMGKAAGHFCYNEDPDGTLIEYVETHKVPILKKIGWYLDLRKRKTIKPLPDWMVKCMGLGKKSLELAGQ
ncbi:MAG TPA: VOC family protein, partial [Flavobacteriales bacterium]|nr:VOC family protein [Flavobacteriales bacterium]